MYMCCLRRHNSPPLLYFPSPESSNLCHGQGFLGVVWTLLGQLFDAFLELQELLWRAEVLAVAAVAAEQVVVVGVLLLAVLR